MSKSVKLIFLALGGLSLILVLLTGITMSQKTKLQRAKTDLENEVQLHKDRQAQYLQQNKDLETQLASAQNEKEKIATQLQEMREVQMPALEEKIQELTSKKDKWQARLDQLTEERDELVKKLKEKPEKEIVYVEKEAPAAAPVQPAIEVTAGPPPDVEEESYWAGVLRAKANLQLETEQLQKEMSALQVELVEVKKENSDLQLELAGMKDKNETMAREIEHGKDLADTLSLEVAKTQNEKKFLDSRLTKISGENNDLREKIKQLTSTKIALEKSIVRMQEEQKGLQDKLAETENVIQNRIDEIWDIKKGIEESFRPTKTQHKGEVELTPIVVSTGPHETASSLTTSSVSGIEGNIVSVNDENNFVIVDIGKTDGIRLGDNLGVYRGAEYVAGLEVIQVRDDIAAADIKNKVTSVQVGDLVR